MIKKIILLLLLGSLTAWSGSLPHNFNLDGVMLDSSDLPLTSPQTVYFRIYNHDYNLANPTLNCLLYEETQSVVIDAYGNFSVKIGDLVGGANRTSNDPSLNFRDIFQNYTQVRASGANCTNGYTAPSNAGRKLVIIVGSTQLTALNLASVPMALVAENAQTLQGKESSEFLQTNVNVTQAKADNVFSSSNWTELQSLIAGTSTKYASTSSSAGVSLPIYAGVPSSPVPGSIWYDSGSQQIKYRNSSTTQTLSTGGGDITDVVAGSGLVGGASSGSATLTLDASGVSPGSYTKVTVDAFGRVTAGTSLIAADLPTSAVVNGGQSLGAPISVGSNDGFNLSLKTNNVARMTIDSVGKVGVGTASPAETLHVHSGSAPFGIYIQSTDTWGGIKMDGSGTVSTISSGNIAGNPSIKFDPGNDSIEDVVISHDNGNGVGKLGINTSNPWAILEVVSDGANGKDSIAANGFSSTVGNHPSIRIQRGRGSAASPTNVINGDPIGALYFTGFGAGFNSLGSARIAAYASENHTASYHGTNLLFETVANGVSSAPVPRLTVTHDGKVGIGTTAPTVDLDIATTGAVKFPAGTTPQRPVSPGSGSVRYHTTNQKLEVYASGVWKNLITGTNCTGGPSSSGASSFSISCTAAPGTPVVCSPDTNLTGTMWTAFVNGGNTIVINFSAPPGVTANWQCIVYE